MKICFLCRGFVSNGGIGRVVAVMSNKMVESCEVHLLSFYDEKASSYYEINPKCKQYVLFSEPVTMTKAILLKHAVKRLRGYLEENRIDIVIACGALFYPLAVIASKKAGIRNVCWEHTNPNNKRDYRFQDLARRFGAKRSDLNVVLTKSALKVYEARFPKSKTIQIYNPIDPLLFVEKHEYEDASKKIISVGRLRPQKNFSRLLDIASETLKEYPEWQWDIYGEGPLREDLEKKRDSLGLREQVHFCGQVSDLYSRYHNYSFMVMTSDYEGFPMTLLEGAANGLPMLSFDIPTGPSEIIEDGKNGFLCDNIEQMQSAIKSLITDAERRCVMSVESRRTASHFGVEEVCNQWMSALNKTM